MLTVSPVRNIDYYIDIARDDYYLDGEEPKGVWAGSASRLLGLRGYVEKVAYRNVLQGYTPDRQFLLRKQAKGKQRAGWDLTFSAPKSVSVAWARVDIDCKQRIQKAHEKAVLSAITFLEDKATFTRLGKSGHIHQRPVGVVVSLFEHAAAKIRNCIPTVSLPMSLQDRMVLGGPWIATASTCGKNL